MGQSHWNLPYSFWVGWKSKTFPASQLTPCVCLLNSYLHHYQRCLRVLAHHFTFCTKFASIRSSKASGTEDTTMLFVHLQRPGSHNPLLHGRTMNWLIWNNMFCHQCCDMVATNIKDLCATSSGGCCDLSQPQKELQRIHQTNLNFICHWSLRLLLHY